MIVLPVVDGGRALAIAIPVVVADAALPARPQPAFPLTPLPATSEPETNETVVTEPITIPLVAEPIELANQPITIMPNLAVILSENISHHGASTSVEVIETRTARMFISLSVDEAV